MSTVQVEDDIKKELFAIAAELQSKLGRRVSLSEAVRMLLETYKANERDVAKMLSLFGCLVPIPEAKKLLREIRAEEEKELEHLTRKPNA